MVYMAADNNLEKFAVQDLNEMEEHGSTGDVNVVVQVDRHPKSDEASGYTDSNGDWTDTRRYYVTQDDDPGVINSNLIEKLGELDMSHPQTFMDFMRWAVGSYPAERYAVVMWDHGDGIFSSGLSPRQFTRGFTEDWTNGSKEMQLWEMREVMETAMDELNGGERFDLLAFDQCFMGHVETAFELAGTGDYLVASADEEPDVGWDYSPILEALVETPKIGTDELAALISREYVELFAPTLNYITQAAMDLEPFRGGGYDEALGEFAGGLIDAMYEHRGTLKDIRSGLHEYSSNNVDPYDFASRVAGEGELPLALRETASDFMMAHQEAILHHGHGTLHPDSAGPAIYFPTRSVRSDYDHRLVIRDHRWNDFVHHFVSPHEMAHTGLTDTEAQNIARDVEASLTGASMAADTFRVQFRAADDDDFFSIPMKKQGSTELFSAMLPGQSGNMTVHYYFIVEDAGGYTFLYPTGADPDAPGTLYSYFTGPDTSPPVISHTPSGYIPLGGPLEVEAGISDAFGIDGSSPSLHYALGGDRDFTTLGMSRVEDNRTVQGGGYFTASIPSSGEETTIGYYITASDSAANVHEARAPPTGEYSVPVSYRPGTVLIRTGAAGATFDTLAEVAAGLGFRVDTTDSSIDVTGDMLEGYKTFIDTCMSCGLTYDEASVLRGFAKGGGELLFVSDSPAVWDAPGAGTILKSTGLGWEIESQNGSGIFDAGANLGLSTENPVTRVMQEERVGIWDGDLEGLAIPVLTPHVVEGFGADEGSSGEGEREPHALLTVTGANSSSPAVRLTLAATGYLGTGKVALVSAGILDDDSPMSPWSADFAGWLLEWLGRNEAPVADGGGNVATRPGEEVTLDASASYDPDGEVASWFWTLPDGSTSEEPVVKVTLEQLGVYPTTLTVKDNEGGIGYTQVLVNVTLPPTVYFTADSQSVPTHHPVSFTADALDPDGYVAAYRWDFGDGHFGSGEKVDYSWGGKGDYRVNLTVTDNHGLSETWGPVRVRVMNQGPTAVLDITSVRVNDRSVVEAGDEPVAGDDQIWALEIVEDDVVTFNGSSSHDPDSVMANLTFYWQSGDGSLVEGPMVLDHTYTAMGNYTVLLTVEDEEGENSMAYMRVLVNNSRPTALASIESRDGLLVRFDASGSSDTPSDERNLTYRWDFGDGSTETTADRKVSHTYGSSGEYEVELRVTDDNGESDVYRFTMEVRFFGRTTGALLLVVLIVVAAVGWLWYSRRRKRKAAGRDGDGGDGDAADAGAAATAEKKPPGRSAAQKTVAGGKAGADGRKTGDVPKVGISRGATQRGGSGPAVRRRSPDGNGGGRRGQLPG
jgi:PKD repeat protein